MILIKGLLFSYMSLKSGWKFNIFADGNVTNGLVNCSEERLALSSSKKEEKGYFNLCRLILFLSSKRNRVSLLKKMTT